MSIDVQLNRAIKASRLRTFGEGPLKKPIFGHNRTEIRWELEFSVDRWSSGLDPKSVIIFTDRRLVTQRLISEIYYHSHSRFPQVADLVFSGISISLRDPPSNRYDKHQHDIHVEGKANHSYLEWKVTDFTHESRANDVQMQMIEDLVKMAIEGDM